jgi:hypothetical protein
MTDIRVSRVQTEALVQTDPDINLSRVQLESLVQTDPEINLSRVYLEMVISESTLPTTSLYATGDA